MHSWYLQVIVALVVMKIDAFRPLIIPVSIPRHAVRQSISLGDSSNFETKKNLFIYGMGYVGKAVAREAILRNYSVSGTIRGPRSESKEEGSFMQDTCLFESITEHGALLCSVQPSHILVTIPPSSPDSIQSLEKESTKCNIADSICQGLQTYQFTCPGRLLWVGYLSSTGVYSESKGGLVDETSPTWVSSSGTYFPDTSVKASDMHSKAVRRAWVERQWIDHARANGIPLHVFRLGGIYGPGRNLFKRLRSQQNGAPAVSGVDSVLVNRIHVEDIATVLFASMSAPSEFSEALFNVVDNLPATQSDVLRYCEQLIGPSMNDASRMMTSRTLDLTDGGSSSISRTQMRGSNKRVSNTKMNALLARTDHRLKFPTFKE